MLTLQRIGIILTVIGTYLLAISVKTKYSGLVIEDEENNSTHLTETFIDKKLFRIGLGIVALGSLFQW